MLGASGLWLSGFASVDVPLSPQTTATPAGPTPPADCRVVLAVSSLWLSSHPGVVGAGRLVGQPQASPAHPAERGLKVRPKPKRIPRQGVSTGLPIEATHRNHVWTWDFIFDRTDKGSTLKMLTMLDEYTRQCLAIRVERQIKSGQVLATLWQAMMAYGLPEHIRSDNGTEFIAGKIQRWLHENQIKTLYIEPGSPWQNGYIESFHSRFRDECLNREWLLNLREARVVIEDWRQHYNTERPHSRLGYLIPEHYIKHRKVSSKWAKRGCPVRRKLASLLLLYPVKNSMGFSRCETRGIQKGQSVKKIVIASIRCAAMHLNYPFNAITIDTENISILYGTI